MRFFLQIQPVVFDTLVMDHALYMWHVFSRYLQCGRGVGFFHDLPLVWGFAWHFWRVLLSKVLDI